MRLTILFIAVFAIPYSNVAAEPREECTSCHRIAKHGVHRKLACRACHSDGGDRRISLASAGEGASGCVGCHRGYNAIFTRPMATRSREHDFVQRAFGRDAGVFFAQNCNSCHLTGCLDCHGPDGHDIGRPQRDACLPCHRGYFVGADYVGRAPREDSIRYQRGPAAYGEHFLTMLPDIHAEAGMSCGSCHSMQSLAGGKAASAYCTDCHKPSARIVEHRIRKHLERMECYACHSAWAAQEYGTFFIRPAAGIQRSDFLLRESGGKALRSAYLRRQDAPPLGLNSKGLVSPIRPAFIVFAADGKGGMAGSKLLAAEWKAFFPHTVRRGAPLCEACHATPRRFMLEDPRDRIYDLKADGLALDSFWNTRGQRVVNGTFFPEARYAAIAGRSPEYRRMYIEKWQTLIRHVAPSSGR